MIKIAFVGGRGYLSSNLQAYYKNHYNGALKLTVIDDKDLSEIEPLEHISWCFDFVIILAGETGTLTSFRDPIQNTRNNNFVLLNILKSIAASPYRPTVIFPSSRLVYQGSEKAIGIKDRQAALTIYAANKIACEHYLNAYRAKFSIPNIILRLGVPYGSIGAVSSNAGTIWNLIDQAKRSGEIQIFGDGSQTRTFTHIEDLATYLYQLMSRESQELSQTVNIPGENLSLKTAAELVAQSYNSKIAYTKWDAEHFKIESGSTAFALTREDTIVGYKLKHSLCAWLEQHLDK